MVSRDPDQGNDREFVLPHGGEVNRTVFLCPKKLENEFSPIVRIYAAVLKSRSSVSGSRQGV